MIVADLAQLAFLLTLLMAIIRWIEGKLSPQSDTHKALAYLFH